MDGVNTPPNDTTPSTSALYISIQGMHKAEARAAEAAQALAQGNLDPANFVSLIEAGHMYTANAKAVQTHDERTGQLLEILA
ncbi:MAG: hypothetical protein ACFBZ8_09475 [Opitutales bacterium]